MVLKQRVRLWFFVGMVCFQGSLSGQELIQVLNDRSRPREMMQQWLMGQANERFNDWSEAFEQRSSREQIADYQARLRRQFIQHLGGFPERTPLNAEVTGTIERDDLRIEKVIFESQPGLHVSSALFLPKGERFDAPFPAVLVVCGHSAQAKAYPAYQTACSLLAKNGIAALIIDPICQGERYQHLREDGSVELPSTTAGHSLVGLGCILLGENTARHEIWDAMRAIDYLQSRDEIDGTRIGVMGNSGGGTQTSYIMALDDRIKAASPACYITSFERLLNSIGPQDAEQNIYGQLAFGMDHADYLMMRAPTPTLICCATNDFFDIGGTWESFRRAKRLYGRLGFSERIELAETENSHGWHQPLREAAVRWMVRWLAHRDEPIVEKDIELFDERELWATPEGQVLRLPGARSVFELNQERNQQLSAARARLWQDRERAIERVHELSGIRRIDQLPAAEIFLHDTLESEGIRIQQLTFHPEDGIVLPALLYQPPEPDTSLPWVVFVHQDGKQGTPSTITAMSLAEQGRTVLAVDLRGTGETKPEDAVWYDPRFGEDGKHLMIAYLLGRNYVGMRAEDIVICARWAVQQDELNQEGVDLVAYGEIGTSALHASALNRELFRAIEIHESIKSWEAIVVEKYSEDQLVNVVHGALTAYDLTDLAAYVGDKLKQVDHD